MRSSAVIGLCLEEFALVAPSLSLRQRTRYEVGIAIKLLKFAAPFATMTEQVTFTVDAEVGAITA
jgi:hypothetical protein